MTTNNVTPFPAVKPGYKLAPARIGRGDRKQIIYIECPNWCTQDHVENFRYDVEDITHYGDMSSVIVPTMTSDHAHFVWSVQVSSDPTASEPSLRGAHVLIDDEDTDTARLTPDMADELADELIGLASDIRHAARTARLHNQTVRNADSDPDMDEALRRVREGGVA